MQYFTGSDLESRIRTELDIIDEPIISQTEILNYLNEAIDIAEAQIHTINEDYFLTSQPVALVQGTADYAFPSNIYSDKVRAIMYHNGPIIYQVRRLRGLRVFQKLKDIDFYGVSDRYMHIVYNDSASSGPKFRLYPTSRETSSAVMTIWYLRNANRLSVIGDTVDIPEWTPFVVAYCKMKCVLKMKDRDPATYIAESEQMKKDMVETLSNRFPDDDNMLPLDLDIYREMGEWHI